MTPLVKLTLAGGCPHGGRYPAPLQCRAWGAYAEPCLAEGQLSDASCEPFCGIAETLDVGVKIRAKRVIVAGAKRPNLTRPANRC